MERDTALQCIKGLYKKRNDLTEFVLCVDTGNMK